MLTGYNTDVEYNGVVYHVQTEDKGLATPIILSLVYSGGAILASKRSPYDDLIQEGFDDDVLAERLQRQHRLICAAVHAGRIDELKQMSERDSAAKGSVEKKRENSPSASVSADPAAPARRARRGRTAAGEEQFSVSTSGKAHDSLKVTLLEEKELRSGESVTLRLLVTRVSPDNQEPVKKARVTIKTLGSTFRPIKATSTTDNDGVAEISLSLPQFKTGRGAILVRAEANGETAELRRILQPA